jgi:hypothetical protein
VDPGDALLARADFAADEELERQRHGCEGAAAGAEHDARIDDAQAEVTRLFGLGLPVDAQPRQKVVARAAGLVDAFPRAMVSVVADARDAHEHARLGRYAGDGLHEVLSRDDAAVADAALVGFREAHAYRALAGQVHDGVYAFERLGPGPELIRIPANARWMARAGVAARQHNHRVAAGDEMVDERATDVAGATADDDTLHSFPVVPCPLADNLDNAVSGDWRSSRHRLPRTERRDSLKSQRVPAPSRGSQRSNPVPCKLY